MQLSTVRWLPLGGTREEPLQQQTLPPALLDQPPPGLLGHGWPAPSAADQGLRTLPPAQRADPEEPPSAPRSELPAAPEGVNRGGWGRPCGCRHRSGAGYWQEGVPYPPPGRCSHPPSDVSPPCGHRNASTASSTGRTR
eukprot:scaffold4771_cov129-Isochrysis_galbana.AAC.1